LAAAGVDSAQLKHGYLAEDSSQAQQLAAQYPYAYFLTPEGECFHNATVTGGKPASEGPLALKRELRVTEGSLARLETGLTQAEAEASALSKAIEELAAQLEARSEERRLAERDTADQGASLKQMDSETQRVARRFESGRRRPRATRKRARPSGAQSTKNARRCFASKPSTGRRSCSR